jgi:predicted RNA-binding protein with PIN domain
MYHPWNGIFNPAVVYFNSYGTFRRQKLTSMSPRHIILIDGYNVINRIPELKPSLDGGLESARIKLALQISRWGQDHPALYCVIVFDGDLQFAGGRDQRLSGIRCIFSRTSHGGDDEIIRFVRDYQGRTSDIIVVSDDNNVRNNCRAHGASVQPSSYIITGKTRHSGGRAKTPADGKDLDRKAAAEIEKELKKKFGL